MRSDPKKPNKKGKVAVVLAVLACIWLFIGTLTLMKIKDVIINGTYQVSEIQDQQDGGLNEEDDLDKGENVFDPSEETPEEYPDDQDSEDDLDDGTAEDPDEPDLDDADDTDAEDADADDTDADDDDPDDADDTADDDDDDTLTFTVDAWDGFAAVRTGRGTNYREVGRLVNGEKVKVTDLENGWYKIASGKWKGNYLHKSSLR